MYQDDNMSFSEKKFIFSDDFYSSLESNENSSENANTNTNNISSGIVMPNIIIPQENNINQTNNVINQEPNNLNINIPTYNENNIVNNPVPDINHSIEVEPKVETPSINVPTYNENNVVNNQVPDINQSIEVEPKVETPSINVTTYNEKNVVNNQVPDINQSIEVEPKVETPSINVPTYNENNIVNNPVPDINQSVEINNQNANISENNIDNFNINVETGIDRNLENQLLSIEKEKEDKFSFVLPKEEKPEKSVYRAIRRPTQNNIQLFDNKKENNQVASNPNVVSTIINDQPEIKEDNSNSVEEWEPPVKPVPVIIREKINYQEEAPKDEIVKKSTLLDELKEKEKETGKISILARYGDDFCSREYITNPAIGRDEEIKQLSLILITPEKSAILVGKPGIGKTSIVEGLAYRIQRDNVPNVLKGYSIISVKTTSLLGTLPNGETRLQTLIDELKDLDKIILFIDEIHMLMGATNDSGLDFANMFKESLGRGSIKMIGATTSDEYERYVLRDKAFVRRFQKVDVEEPTQEQTVEILMGTLPKIEKKLNAKLKYTHYIQVEIMKFIVGITSEYKRIYGIGSRYPDICIGLLNNAFSEAIFDNRNEVTINDIRRAISSSKNIYPDVIRKELINFDEQFKNLKDE